jgi:hypothetical protein
MDSRGFSTSLPEFQQVFPDDDACAKYLETMRWPDGFSCPKCRQTGEPYCFPKRSSTVLRCRQCKVNTSLTGGTVMQSTHTPLSTWFWGAYLVTTQTPGQSALQFQRQLGLTRYETAFQILHKLRAGMVRPEHDCIGTEHPVEVDECFVGGRTRGEGRASTTKLSSGPSKSGCGKMPNSARRSISRDILAACRSRMAWKHLNPVRAEMGILTRSRRFVFMAVRPKDSEHLASHFKTD